MFDKDFRYMTKQLTKLPLSVKTRKTIRGQILAMEPAKRHEYFDRILDNCSEISPHNFVIPGEPCGM